MGQKVNPFSYRLPITKQWKSAWYSDKNNYRKWLIEDDKILKFIQNYHPLRTIANVTIERTPNLITINIVSPKVGVVIGRQGSSINKLKSELEKFTSAPVRINVEELKKPELSAKIVAESIGSQLVGRINFRRAAKSALQNTMNSGALGIRISLAGRLNDAEMARREKFAEGSVPLHTLRANVDFYTHHAKTSSGMIGVKVWINRGGK